MFRLLGLGIILFAVDPQTTCAQNSPVTVPVAESKPTELSVAGKRIRAVLASKISLSAKHAQLSEVLRIIDEHSDITISTDQQALRGLEHQPITVEARDVRLSAALGLLLKKPRLTYVIRDDALVITSVKTAAEHQRIKLIAVPEELIKRKEDVVKALVNSCRRELGNMPGGSFEITVAGNSLRVVGHEHVFQHVESSLIRMRESNAKSRPTNHPDAERAK